MTDNTYQLAIDSTHGLRHIGPRMTLGEAQGYQADMTLAGFSIVVVNLSTEAPKPMPPVRRKSDRKPRFAWNQITHLNL